MQELKRKGISETFVNKRSFNKFRAYPLAGVFIEVTSCYEDERNNWEAARALTKCFCSSPKPKYPAMLLERNHLPSRSFQSWYWARWSTRILKRGFKNEIMFLFVCFKSPTRSLLWSLLGRCIFFTKVVRKYTEGFRNSQMDIKLNLPATEWKWNKREYNHSVSDMFAGCPYWAGVWRTSTFHFYGLSGLDYVWIFWENDTWKYKKLTAYRQSQDLQFPICNPSCKAALTPRSTLSCSFGIMKTDMNILIGGKIRG